MRRLFVLSALLLACHGKGSSQPAVDGGVAAKGAADGGAQPSAPPQVSKAFETPSKPLTLTSRAVFLPGAKGAVGLDYIAYDPQGARLWIPAGDTGNVDVYDPASGQVTAISGFKTAMRERNGHKYRAGPSSVAVGEGTIYVGNAGTSEVCPIDAKTLRPGTCVTLSSPPDGLIYVPYEKELWIMTPQDHSITILDSALKQKDRIALDGTPEGYALSVRQNMVYTNLEDKNRTLGIGAHDHKIASDWKLDCGEAGPRGLAIDFNSQLALVACTNRLLVLDMYKKGEITSKVDTGGGVDNIDYLPELRRAFVASGETGKLTEYVLGGSTNASAATPLAVGTTAKGARTVVADPAGNAYVIDPAEGKILVFPAPPVR